MAGWIALALAATFPDAARAANPAPSCQSAGCHAAIGKAKWVHGPVGIGACEVCHVVGPNDRPGKKHDLKLAAAGAALCFSCHQEKEAMRKEAFVHGPVAAEECTPCHDPHQSEHKFQLKRAGADLCFSCHSRDMIAKQNVHGPVKGGNCGACHVPHGSRNKFLLAKERPGLCTDCHAKIGDLIKNSKNVHGPVQEGDCNACHDAHASDNPRRLLDFFPAQFYMPYAVKNYALCFECHNNDIASTPETTSLTDFRDGNRNLHFVHINKEKGRSCKACHEVHAGDQEKHIRKDVPFGSGGWMLPVNFKRTATGGYCEVGCHRPMSYDRAKAAATK
jgi:predicted CXXCH cytochrome family protein